MQANIKMNNEQLPRVQLHPSSIREIQKGHPWITKDSFTERFPQDKLFLTSDKCLFLHDPRHKSVKGRVWSTQGNFKEQCDGFEAELGKRLKRAFEKRIQNKDLITSRENYYLVFGEGDFIPGLFIQKLGSHLFVQQHAFFWNSLRTQLCKGLQKSLSEFFPKENFTVWFQQRGDPRNERASAIDIRTGATLKVRGDLVLKEFDIKYNLFLNEYYDIGIYTDMASIRNIIRPELNQTHSLLNLYAYTGAFSLFALKNGVDEVYSVDLSSAYMKKLEENIDTNADLRKEKHVGLTMAVDDAITKLEKEKHYFDFIICDPPSSSSDGEKTSSALKKYESLLPKLCSLLSGKGQMILFLNTQSVLTKKFQTKIQEILQTQNLDKQFKIVKMLALGEDCPVLKGHHEGNYLKGIWIKRL